MNHYYISLNEKLKEERKLNMKKILVLGASGFAGNTIYKDLSRDFEVYGTYFSQREKYGNDIRMLKLDISVSNDIDVVLEKTKPQIIISCLRGNFNDQLLAHKKSVEYLKTVADGKYIFLSSVNVFDALDKKPHYETDILKSKSEYGKFKIECEQVLQKELKEKAVILRLPFIWGKNSPRLNKILEQIRNENTVTLWSNLYSNNTSDEQIVDYIRLILKNDLNGIFHIGTTETIDYKDFVLRIISISGLKRPKIIEENFKQRCYMAVLSSRNDYNDNLDMTNEELIRNMF